MMKCSVHIPTPSQCVPETQQWKTAVCSCLEFLLRAAGARVHSVSPSRAILSSSVSRSSEDGPGVVCVCVHVCETRQALHSGFPRSCLTGCCRPGDDEVMEILEPGAFVMLGGCYCGTAICRKGQLLGDDSPGPCLPPSCHPHTHTRWLESHAHTDIHTNTHTYTLTVFLLRL